MNKESMQNQAAASMTDSPAQINSLYSAQCSLSWLNLSSQMQSLGSSSHPHTSAYTIPQTLYFFILTFSYNRMETD
jgi:hypothetical protein